MNDRARQAPATVRLGRLAAALEAGRPLHVRDAARLLGVSEMTVRRDLAAGGAALTMLGGYIVPAETLAAPRYRLDVEQESHREAKRAAARHAARLVAPGDTLFIDCGTTMPHLVSALPPEGELTIACYSLNIAQPLAWRPNTRLILLGGLYHPSSASFASSEAIASLARLGITRAFLSAGGVHAARGATCSNFHEVAVKEAAMRAAEESILVIDASKFGRLRPAFFSPLAGFARIVTDSALDPEERARFAAFGGVLDIAG